VLSINKTQYNSFCISADSNEELARSFLRFQEYYESPNDQFRGKIFTLGSYKHWYSEMYGAFTYESDWRGFNFPSIVLEPFKQGVFDPLIDEEKALLSFFSYKNNSKPFYIIGANDDGVLNHELNHALYYYSEDYKKSINALFDQNLEKIKHSLSTLLSKGYCRYMLYDELQSYILDGDEEVTQTVPKKILDKTFDYYNKYSEHHYETRFS